MRFFAPAKVNLSLHITGRRDDGYHLLHSAMALTDIGDVLHMDPADSYSLKVEGPYAHHAPCGDSNLVTRAIRTMEAATGLKAGAAIRLCKNVPAGAGLGGGSADAACAMHGVNALWGSPLDMDALCALGLGVGAEMPFMLRGHSACVEGVGEVVTPLAVQPMPAVVVWCGAVLPTADVFKAYKASGAGFSVCRDMPAQVTGAWVCEAGNDLEPAAKTLAPVIGAAIAALAATRGCCCARMTGSGSAVFGVFDTMDNAMEAAQVLQAAHKNGANPDWWVRACMINPIG